MEVVGGVVMDSNQVSQRACALQFILASRVASMRGENMNSLNALCRSLRFFRYFFFGSFVVGLFTCSPAPLCAGYVRT